MRSNILVTPVFLSAALFLGGPFLPAQTTVKVVPGMYASLPGPTTCAPPFYYEMVRAQFLYRSGALARTGGVIFSMDFRRDSRVNTTYGSITRDLQVDLYVTPVSPASMGTGFAANRGAGKATNLFQGKINLPALPFPSNPPAPWSVSFKFPRPFPFVVSKGNLLFEFVCKGPGQSYSPYYLDAEYLSRTPGGRTNLIGMYCVGKNQAVFKIDPDSRSWILGGNGTVRWGPGGSQPTSIVVFLGQRNDRWGPFKLPFDLAPLGGTSSSKDPCAVRTNWVLARAAGLNQSVSFGPIPNNPLLAGVTVFLDSIAPVPGANPMGIITGPAFAVTIGSNKTPRPDVNTMYLQNNLAGTTGRLYSTSYYRGPIARFQGSFN